MVPEWGLGKRRFGRPKREKSAPKVPRNPVFMDSAARTQLFTRFRRKRGPKSSSGSSGEPGHTRDCADPWTLFWSTFSGEKSPKSDLFCPFSGKKGAETSKSGSGPQNHVLASPKPGFR